MRGWTLGRLIVSIGLLALLVTGLAGALGGDGLLGLVALLVSVLGTLLVFRAIFPRRGRRR